jgi:hypothetical protein
MAKFLNNKKHHDWNTEQIQKHYSVGKSFALKMRKAAGWSSSYEKCATAKDKLLKDPRIGKPGEVCDVPASTLAKEYGCHHSTVRKVRHDLGVIAPLNYGGDPEMWPGGIRTGLTPSERALYKLCAKTRSWGRPEGIDRHLEVLREKARAL